MSALPASSAGSSKRDVLVAGEYPLTTRDFDDIASMIYADAGIHMQASKATLVYSRLVKRLRALQLESFHDYCELIKSSGGGAERQEMLSALTTNVTRFFRENHHFETLRQQALPPLIAAARSGSRVRIWSAGCSSGQEPYSIALTLLGMEPGAASLDIKILATDIDPRMVEEGRQGNYSSNLVSDVEPGLRKRYFRSLGDARQEWQVSDELKQLVAFRKLNLNASWPMQGQFQIIFCRNVVIYFDSDTQQHLWTKFAAQMAPGGWLFVGHSERVSGPASRDFAPSGITTYRRNDRRSA